MIFRSCILRLTLNAKGENNMITKQEVYANGIDWLINRNDEKKHENQSLKRHLERKSIIDKIIEYIKEII